MITINATGDTTLHTAGKYCPEDILVKVPAGSSGGAALETCNIFLVDSSVTQEFSAVTAYFTCLNVNGTIQKIVPENDGIGWYAENVIIGSTIILDLSATSVDATTVSCTDCSIDTYSYHQVMCFTILTSTSEGMIQLYDY